MFTALRRIPRNFARRTMATRPMPHQEPQMHFEEQHRWLTLALGTAVTALVILEAPRYEQDELEHCAYDMHVDPNFPSLGQ